MTRRREKMGRPRGGKAPPSVRKYWRKAKSKKRRKK